MSATPTPARVLVVDDYPDAANVVCLLLRLLGHDASAACTGSEAIAAAESGEFSIALVDIGLPDISGYEVARALRKLPAGRAMYMVSISGWGQPQDRIRALEAGFDDHVVKPIDSAIVKRILAHAQAITAAGSDRA